MRRSSQGGSIRSLFRLAGASHVACRSGGLTGAGRRRRGWVSSSSSSLSSGVAVEVQDVGASCGVVLEWNVVDGAATPLPPCLAQARCWGLCLPKEEERYIVGTSYSPPAPCALAGIGSVGD